MNLDPRKFSWWPGKKNKTEEVKKYVVPPGMKEVINENGAPQNLPIATEDLFLADTKIRKLKEKRKEKIKEHRNARQDLEIFGVRKTNKDGKRTATHQKSLGPIEKELREISKEINETRESLDMKPSRATVLIERLQRLEEIKQDVQRKFEGTSVGKQYKEYLKELQNIDKKRSEKEKEYYESNPKFFYGGDKELDELRSKIITDFERKIKSTKDYMNYIRTIKRIDDMIVDTDDWLNRATSDKYDENGFNEVR